MEMAEWSSVLSRIAPALERLDDSRIHGSQRQHIPGDANEPEAVGTSCCDQLPGSHMAGMEIHLQTDGPRSDPCADHER